MAHAVSGHAPHVSHSRQLIGWRAWKEAGTRPWSSVLHADSGNSSHSGVWSVYIVGVTEYVVYCVQCGCDKSVVLIYTLCWRDSCVCVCVCVL